VIRRPARLATRLRTTSHAKHVRAPDPETNPGANDGSFAIAAAQPIGGPRAPMHAINRRLGIVDVPAVSPNARPSNATRAPSGSEHNATDGSDSSSSFSFASELESKLTGLPSGTDPNVARSAVSALLTWLTWLAAWPTWPPASVESESRLGPSPRVPVHSSANISSAAKNATPDCRALDWIEPRTSTTSAIMGGPCVLVNLDFAALIRDARAAAPDSESGFRASPPTRRCARARS
jgi:hypothetical protein